MKRNMSDNERLVISKVNLGKYYNKFIVPLNPRKFMPMSVTEGDSQSNSHTSTSKNTGLCPFHDDTDPSLHWWKQKNIFHCFGCGAGGDVIVVHQRLMRERYNRQLKIPDIVKELAAEFDIKLDETEGFRVKSPFELAKERLSPKTGLDIPRNVFTLAEYSKLNKRIMSSELSVEAKIASFAQLDLVASVSLSNRSQ